MKHYNNMILGRMMKAYKLLVFDGLTLREIGKRLNVSRQTVYLDLTMRLKDVDYVKYEDVIEQFKENHKRGYLAGADNLKRIKEEK